MVRSLGRANQWTKMLGNGNTTKDKGRLGLAAGGDHLGLKPVRVTYNNFLPFNKDVSCMLGIAAVEDI